jgi:hypothetical protein
MKVHELISALSKLPADAAVEILIRDARDTAYTKHILSVGEETSPTGHTRIVGWVSSDDEDACAPWSCDR